EHLHARLQPRKLADDARAKRMRVLLRVERADLYVDERLLRRLFKDNALHFHRCAAGLHKAELVGGRIREIDDAPRMEGPSVVDADHDAAPILQVSNARVAGNGQRRMRSRHGEHVVDLAARRLLAMKAAAVPARQAALPEGLQAHERHVLPAEYTIRAIR